MPDIIQFGKPKPETEPPNPPPPIRFRVIDADVIRRMMINEFLLGGWYAPGTNDNPTPPEKSNG